MDDGSPKNLSQWIYDFFFTCQALIIVLVSFLHLLVMRVVRDPPVCPDYLR